MIMFDQEMKGRGAKKFISLLRGSARFVCAYGHLDCLVPVFFIWRVHEEFIDCRDIVFICEKLTNDVHDLLLQHRSIICPLMSFHSVVDWSLVILPMTESVLLSTSACLND